MKTKLMAIMMLAAGSAFAETHFSIGVGIGTPGYYAPAPYAVAARPPFPGPGFVWIDGYYDAYGQFVPGYWARLPYADAYWIAPRFDGGRYFAGFWGRRGFAENRRPVGNGFVGNGFSGHRFDRDDHFRGRDADHGNRSNGNQNRGHESNRGSRR